MIASLYHVAMEDISDRKRTLSSEQVVALLPYFNINSAEKVPPELGPHILGSFASCFSEEFSVIFHVHV